MKTVAVVTSTRAEYGILTPLIHRILQDPALELRLLVTGTHLSERYGMTKNEILADGFPIAAEIPILDDENSAYGVSKTVANAVTGFAALFAKAPPDLVVILGDRTEMLGVAVAAMNARVPIAHLHGGELTEGAVDDSVRHALTKMSALHFPCTEVYRQRILRLGEQPARVLNVGSLATENILKQPLLAPERVRADLGVPAGAPFAVVTFHPVTLESGTARRQTDALIEAMKREEGYHYVITMANADDGGKIVNDMLSDFASHAANAGFFKNLGMIRYLSAVKAAAFVLGNSSSGVLEAPVLGTPTVNIGDRQKGRLMAGSVVPAAPETDSIVSAIRVAAAMPHNPALLFGDGSTSEKIVTAIKAYLAEAPSLKKTFYEGPVC